MSTKIYNAVRFHSDVTLEQIAKWADKLRPLIHEMDYKKTEKKILQDAITEFDKMTLEGCAWRHNDAPKNRSAIGQAISNVRSDRDLMIKHGGRDDSKAELQVIIHGKRIYAFLNMPDDVVKMVNSKYEGKMFDEYCYWNNTDRPDEVSAKEWRQRKKVWEAVFKNTWSIQEIGMTFSLSQYQGFERSIIRFVNQYRDKPEGFEAINAQALEQAMPDIKARAKRMHDFIDHGPWKPEQLGTNADFAPIMRYLREIERDEIPSFAEAYPFLMKHVIIPEVSIADLFTKLEQMEERHQQLREHLFTLDVPSSLRTPSFETAVLEFQTRDHSAPQSARKKI